MIPSKYQQGFYDFITNGTGNAIGDAVAGSGKSTTIVNCLKLIPENESVLFLAFNKAIVEELKKKIMFHENVDIKTLHSLGAYALTKGNGCKIDGSKYKAFLNDALKNEYFKPAKKLKSADFSEYKQNILKMVDLVRVNLCNNVNQFKDIAQKHGLNLHDNELEICAKVARWGYKNDGVIDFTDMIYFPVAKNIDMPQYDWVFIDECQDLNKAQRSLFLKCIKPITGRFVAVGDPRQAIYGFAGADAESFENLKSIPNTTLLPLSVCYRCDLEIIKMAQSLVPQIEARDNAPKGTYEANASVNDVKDGDMILCRNTAPLSKLCIEYIKTGVKAYIKGADIGLNLVNIIKGTNTKTMADVYKKLNREHLKNITKIKKQLNCSNAETEENPLVANFLDKIEAIEALAFGLISPDQVCNRIKGIFSNTEKQGICLSTIHKSKGLEADRVFILCPEKLYSKYAEKAQWMMDQEANLVYVAYTRAKHYLGIIKDFKS